MHTFFKAALGAALLVSLGAATAGPAGASSIAGGYTYYVSPSGSDTNPGTQAAPFATIGAALSADTYNYDTIVLEDGAYSGPGNRDLGFGGRQGITVESQNGAAHVTIDCGGTPSSDGSGNHRGFFLNSGEQGAALQGLTIQNGYESSAAPAGQAGGGGVFIGGGCTVSVTGCVFSNNHGYGSGGGLFTYGQVNVQQCAFFGNSGNTETSGGDGSALNVNGGGAATAVNCLFAGNNGTAIDNFNSLTLVFCTFTQNQGGGLLSFGPATLTDDVFYGDAGTEVYDGGSASGGTAVTATYCDVQGGYAGTGNIATDPLFVNGTSSPYDLHLRVGSPCSGAGVSAGYGTDYDGNPRPSPPSLGAYEGTSVAATTLAVANASTSYYQTVTLTATLTAGGTGLAGKTVTFKAGSLTVGTGVTNASGVATKTLTNAGGLGVGSYTLTATFTGDSSNAASSGTGTLTIAKATPTIAVANASGAQGTTVTLSATLKRTSDGALMSGRTLTFVVDGVSVGTAVTSSGVATRSYAIPSGASVGSHTVTVTFPAEANYSAASGTGTLTVTQGVVTPTTLAVANASTSYYQTVTLTATLTGGGSGVSGKTVTFKAGSTTVGTAVTNASGVATKTFANAGGLAAGSYTLTASFAGDAGDSASSGTGTLTVTKATPTVTVASVTGTHGTTVTLTATLSRSSDGALMSNRTLTFLVDGASVGAAVTSSGVASKSYAIPAGATIGNHTVTVTFPAEANYSGASGTGTLTVN